MAKYSVTPDDLQDGTLGICLNCGNIRDGCEPDARNYECDSCEEHMVFGLEEALIMGALDITDEDGDSEVF